MSDKEYKPDEIEHLKTRATKLGIKFHPSVGIKTLEKKIALKLTPDSTQEDPDVTQPETKQELDMTALEDEYEWDPASVQIPEEAKQVRNARLRKEAGKLVRVRIANLNPDKRSHPGNYHAAGNSVVGTFKKYIPYQSSEPYHIPNILYKTLLETEYQTFAPKKMPNGDTINVGRLVKEFAIELLPNLTQAELEKLAQQQAESRSIDR